MGGIILKFWYWYSFEIPNPGINHIQQTKFPVTLQSQRIKLRCFEAADLEDIFLVLSHHEVMRYSLSGPYSRAKTEEFLTWCQSQYQLKGHGLFAITCPPEKRVVGYCGYYFQEIDAMSEVEIGYRLHPDYWGRGIATESAALVRDFGFNSLKLPRLISIIEPENTPSLRVAEKIGMTFWKPHLFKGRKPVRIYSIENPIAEPARGTS